MKTVSHYKQLVAPFIASFLVGTILNNLFVPASKITFIIWVGFIIKLLTEPTKIQQHKEKWLWMVLGFGALTGLHTGCLLISFLSIILTFIFSTVLTVINKFYLFLSYLAALLTFTTTSIILSYVPTVIPIAISCTILGPIKSKIIDKMKQKKKTDAVAVAVFGALAVLGSIFGSILAVLAGLFGLSFFSVSFTNSFHRRHRYPRQRGNSLPPANPWGWDCLPNTHYTDHNINEMMAGKKTTITQEGHQLDNNWQPQYTGQTWTEDVYLQAVVQQNTGNIIHINQSQTPFTTPTIPAAPIN